eukprot:624859-Pelagomonas_calceolata.AAC.4
MQRPPASSPTEYTLSSLPVCVQFKQMCTNAIRRVSCRPPACGAAGGAAHSTTSFSFCTLFNLKRRKICKLVLSIASGWPTARGAPPSSGEVLHNPIHFALKTYKLVLSTLSCRPTACGPAGRCCARHDLFHVVLCSITKSMPPACGPDGRCAAGLQSPEWDLTNMQLHAAGDRATGCI